MTEAEHREVQCLGALRAAVHIFDGMSKPQRQDVHNMWEQVSNLLRKTMLKQYEATEHLLRNAR